MKAQACGRIGKSPLAAGFFAKLSEPQAVMVPEILAHLLSHGSSQEGPAMGEDRKPELAGTRFGKGALVLRWMSGLTERRLAEGEASIG